MTFRILITVLGLTRLAIAAQHDVPGFTFASRPKSIYVSAQTASDSLHIPYSYDARSDLAFLGPIPLDYQSAVGEDRFVSIGALKTIGATIATEGDVVYVSLNGASISVRGGPKTAVVDKATQTMQMYQGGALVMSSRICSGKYSRSTPEGTFVLGAMKDAYHASSSYGDAPMPWAVQVRGPIYIHSGEILDKPSSHGCVRLPDDAAKWFFDWAEPGTVVTIKG